MLSPFSLAERAVLITGGATGIGRATAHRFAEAGARVVITGRRGDLLDAAADAIGGGVVARPFDVTDTDSVPRLLDDVESVIGPLDVLVHAAGTQTKREALDHTDDDWSEAFNVHVRALAALAGGVALRSRDRAPVNGGRAVVAIGSMAAHIGFRRVAAYTAAKGGVVALVRSLAVEWAPLGLRVNAVTPGWIETPMTDRAFEADPAHRQRIVARTPLGRIGDPDDIALAALYLASPAARFVTGTELVVDGGVSVAL